jgi:hypothetical protein
MRAYISVCTYFLAGTENDVLKRISWLEYSCEANSYFSIFNSFLDKRTIHSPHLLTLHVWYICFVD